MGLVLIGRLRTAEAMVTEPPVQGAAIGETVPRPTPTAEISVVTSRGFSIAAATLQGLFTSRGEMIDPVKDAQTKPGTFSPQCDFTGQLVMRAGGCLMGFGWYNATEGATAPPPQSDIHEILPAAFPTCPATIDPATSCCDELDFCPLASHDTTQVSYHRWNMVPFSAATIRADARYTGGSIGFVLMGGASGQCNQNKYSQLDINEKSPSGQAWVGALVYPSTVAPNSYYLAFETEPTSRLSWKGATSGNDGDFNDYVVFIEGACADVGAGGAKGTAGNGGAPGTGGQGGGAGGSPGAGGDNRAAGGMGGAGEQGGGGASSSGGTGGGTSGGAAGSASGSGGATGGATASDAGVDGSGRAGATGGVPPASSSRSGCSCSAIRGDGADGAPAVAGVLLALAFIDRRRRRT